MCRHGAEEDIKRTVNNIIEDRRKGMLLLTGVGSSPCPLEYLKLTLHSVTLSEMQVGPEERLFIDAKGIPMPGPEEAWITKGFLVDGAHVQTTGDEAFIRRVEAVPMRVLFEQKGEHAESFDVLSHSGKDRLVAYMRTGMHNQVSAQKERAEAKSPHWWDDQELVTGNCEKHEFVARVMDHLVNQYDGPIGSDSLTWGFPRVGDKINEFRHLAREFRSLSVGIAEHADEQGKWDKDMSDMDPTRGIHRREVSSFDTLASGGSTQANPKEAKLKDRLTQAHPRLFGGGANNNPPDRGKLGTAKMKVKPNPKIYPYRENDHQGERAEAVKKLLIEFIERGLIQHSDSEWASPAIIVKIKENGECRLFLYYRE